MIISAEVEHDIRALMTFYGAASVEELIFCQKTHIIRLQANFNKEMKRPIWKDRPHSFPRQG